MPEVKILAGTYAEYVAIETKSDSALYFCDNGQLFKGEVSYSDQIAVVSALPDTLVAGKVYVNTTDKSVTYYDGTTSTVAVPATVGTIGDSTPDNDLANVKAIKDFIKAQIDKIPAAKDYTIMLEDTTAGENELTKQILKQGESGKETKVGTISVPKLVMDTSVTENNMAATYKFIYGGVEVGKVNIPKDLVVTQDGSEIIRVDDNHPVSGLNNGVYLKLMIQNSANPVYIDVKDLGGTYTGKIVTNGISISVSDANEISAALVGKAVSESNLSDELANKINSQSDWEQTDTTAYDYIKNKPTFNELTKADIETMLGLSPEELEGLASLINDNEIRTDKTYSSSKIYSELQKVSKSGKSAYEIAVDNGFEGTEEEWLESLKGAEGKSIKSITADENNNVIVTFTDNTTQNIGKLTVDVQADFLTDGGFGNLRYYNGHFQYYNTASSAWVDTSVTPENVYVMNMAPQPMKSISCKYDKNTGKLYLKFTEPNDTIIDGQVFCAVEKVIIRRKLGSVPTDENDGDLVIEVLRHDFGTYSKKWFTDKGITPNIGGTYYYKAFPMSTTGFYNYSDLNVASVTCKEYVLYGFMIDQNESDPANMITYLPDCDNADYNSVFMDFDNNVFNYGDWGNAWFIADLMPCMLKYDGTVDYELDKDDYSKKINGSDSDIANTAYEGNAMVGIPKVYWKIIDNGDNTAKVYVCNSRLDDDFHCWSHIDNNGNEIDYCYMPIYNGSNIDNILRSLSNQTPIKAVSCENEINYALNNNKDSNIIWYIETFSDRMLINILLMLIGKSTDSQAIFGSGNCTLKGLINSGTMDSKGLFWGNTDGTSGVKIFGIENWWGNQWRRIAGWINNNGTQKIKMTYGQSDGTIVDGYTLNGDGYISLNTITIPTSSGYYIDKLSFTNYGILPISERGSSTTYYADGLWCSNNNIYFACMGGDSYEKTYQAGMFATLLQFSITQTDNNIASSISCKPLAPTP